MRKSETETGAASEGGPAPTRQRQQRALDTRERILAAALVEFAEHGFAGASTRAVAAAAGVQHPLVNYHFKSKQGLWQAVLAATAGQFMAQFGDRIAGLRGVDDVTKLRLVQEDFVRFSAAHPYFHQLMSQESRQPSKQLSAMVKEFVRPYFAEITALIRSAQRAGYYVEGDPYHLQYLFIGAATRIFSLAAEVKLIAGASPFAPQMLEQHVEACLGLFFRSPSAASDRIVPSSRQAATKQRRPSAIGRRPRGSQA
jgi:TetR/AcrR family transcriptional regulator